MKEKVVCENCGKETNRKSSNQRQCSECRKKLQKEADRMRWTKYYQQNKEKVKDIAKKQKKALYELRRRHPAEYKSIFSKIEKNEKERL